MKNENKNKDSKKLYLKELFFLLRIKGYNEDAILSSAPDIAPMRKTIEYGVVFKEKATTSKLVLNEVSANASVHIDNDRNQFFCISLNVSLYIPVFFLCGVSALGCASFLISTIETTKEDDNK